MLNSFTIISFLQWSLLLSLGTVFFFLAPYSKSVAEFFAARSKKGKQPSVFLLTSSLVISWIFAKSITNVANLSLQFGFVGSLAYAVYYLSFVVGGLVIYQLRVRGGFKSIHHFLELQFGKSAVLLFSVLIGIRLFNEVWSNTMIIGSYFGAYGTTEYFIAILVFTSLTLAYTLKGGLRSSLLTDAIQMVLFGVLLFVILSFIIPQNNAITNHYITSGKWELSMGLNLLFVAFIQIFSYPFHDPVLTDRGFISSPKTTLKSYLWASLIGFLCILCFGMVGFFAGQNGIEGQAAVGVSKLLGVVGMLIMNFIMITSAASTLDSTFSSFSKLMVVDLRGRKTPSVKKGYIAMLILTVAGTLPVFLNPEILSATTVSGTMVIGLAPVFLLWKIKTTSISFYLSVGFGIMVGIIVASDNLPTTLLFSEGKYADLLAANLWGSIGCFVLYLLPVIRNKYIKYDKKNK